ncbi:MAG: type II/IV secretion system protein [Epsilonproteobacteria bacterium]|nr:type II/IV secretion system protein [Campylobacterota bacterium]
MNEIIQKVVEKYKIKKEDVEEALFIQKKHGGNLWNILLNLGIINEEQYYQILKEFLGFKLFREFKGEIKPFKKEDVKFFIQKQFLPFYEDKNKIYVATQNPFDISIVTLLERSFKKEPLLFLATPQELKQIKSVYYVEREEDIFQKGGDEEEVERLKELASEAPVIKLINQIIYKAIEMNASDIHFEAQKDFLEVRVRVDGILRVLQYIPKKLKPAVLARLKLLSKMNISETRLPQDGRFSFNISSYEIDFRASTVPTALGESFVLRILKKENSFLDLDSIGFEKYQVETLKKLLKKKQGLFLTTGPTGSGKTSTLYASLNYINEKSIKIITVEDPVEYQLEGVNQIPIKPSINLTFANVLRSILRQDPDVIMVGEIRDKETAEIAIQASLTGHLVLSTLHTNSALGSISRLVEMGVEFYLLKASIIGLMAQRLIRRLCPYCKEKEPTPHLHLDKNYLDHLKLESVSTYKPKGCPKCNFSGFLGRVPVTEIVPFDEEVIKRIEKDINFNNLRELGIVSLKDHATSKYLQGLISYEDLIRFVD